MLETTMIKTLKSLEEVGIAIGVLQKEECGYHFDALKNWDLTQVNSILKKIEKNARILDIGCGESASSVLRFCHKKGYKNLVGIDLSIPIEDRLIQLQLMMKNKSIRPPYKLVKGDATKTNFPNNFFDLIVCVSVIEHGVNINSFFKEASRLLKSHGTLYISTDYWEPKIETGDLRPFDLEWNIFSKKEIENLFHIAEKYNLRMKNHEIPPTEDKTVHWMGKEYTFISLTFEKGLSSLEASH